MYVHVWHTLLNLRTYEKWNPLIQPLSHYWCTPVIRKNL